MASPSVREFRRMKRNLDTQGELQPDGALHTERTNLRLKIADNRFHLRSKTVATRQGLFSTAWSVLSRYDFEPFSVGFATHIPLGSYILKVPDGLSHYLAEPQINIAREFDYEATWFESWKTS
jgi:hypothetical protein